MIVVGMAIAFIFASYGSPHVFVANTPQLNPNLAGNLRAIPASVMAFIQNPTDSDARNNIVQTAKIQQVKSVEGLNYTPIKTGVYAAEHPETGKTIVRIDKGTQLQVHSVTLSDGRVVKVYIPL
ncbi:MAG: hypothetical protein O3B87_01470 [bacterium]|nr:hypothetical protein [bacterium]